MSQNGQWNTLEQCMFEWGPTKPFMDKEFDVKENLSTVNTLAHDEFYVMR